MTLFFFHIPKTGGTSFKRVIETWCQMIREVDLGPARMALIEEQRSNEICVTGHFDGRLRGTPAALINRFPWIVGCPDAFVFTLLRDPIEQAVSAYYHERAAGRTHVSLRDFIERRHEYAYRSVLGIQGANDIGPIIGSFGYVGVTENLQLAADQLADRLAKPRRKVPTENVGKRDGQALTLDASDRRFLETLYSLECELYARARDAVFGRRTIAWASATQFAARGQEQALSSSAVLTELGESSAARLLSFCAQSELGQPCDQFECREPIGLRLEFEILDASASAEPAIVLSRNGHVVFSVAYVPQDGASLPLAAGRHVMNVTIPANLLNIGRFELMASVSTPFPVQHHDETLEPIVIEVVQPEDVRGTAQGSWRTSFPGGVRPLLTWRAES